MAGNGGRGMGALSGVFVAYDVEERMVPGLRLTVERHGGTLAVRPQRALYGAGLVTVVAVYR